ncbi:MAG: Hsp20/alpha crystallin family protein [Candidatus Thermoplasmatota archaeon]|jgi:HSP20 family protein|nr:Hsp20/alpha crystallin family protein [Candidatus Thermoplasmatota archaeon]MCL5794378.1 Hsp20/alpha crystallin family protein [Candidatus Thermoplasmatota archaeon]
MAHRKNYDDDWDEDFFDDFFGGFDFDFKKLNERMMRIFANMKKNMGDMPNEPYVYGFSFRVGPDGKPHFQEFGNIPEREKGRLGPSVDLDQGVREPMTDISEDKEKIYITVELPGISKDNIDLKVTEDRVTVSVKDGNRSYYKSLELESPIMVDSTVAKFTNGILDLVLQKQRKDEQGGKKIRIE